MKSFLIYVFVTLAKVYKKNDNRASKQWKNSNKFKLHVHH
jgi:hypothetical protein